MMHMMTAKNSLVLGARHIWLPSSAFLHLGELTFLPEGSAMWTLDRLAWGVTGSVLIWGIPEPQVYPGLPGYIILKTCGYSGPRCTRVSGT